MNILKKAAACLVALLTVGSAQLYAQDYVVILSPYQSKERLHQKTVQVLKFATQLNPLDRVHVMDGYHLNHLATFTVPENPKMISPAMRMAKNKPFGRALKAFVSKAREPDSGDGSVPRITPRVAGALRIGQALQAVSERYGAGSGMDSGQPLEVLILGSIQHDVPNEPFSMFGGFIPSDGHLAHSRQDTPYGVRGQERLLSHQRLHWVYPDQVDDRHGFFLKRWWSLFAEAQNGQLISFDTDLTSTLLRMASPESKPSHSFKRQDTDKIEMIQLLPRQAGAVQPLHERPISTQAITVTESQRATSVVVGITWDCNACDLDLYAVAMPTASPVYFGRTETPEASFWKDYRTSPDLTHGQESISFNVPLDLRVLTLAVNFYSGQVDGKDSNGVQGEIRLALGERTYALPFTLTANTGNQAKDVGAVLSGKKNDSAHTLLIDPLDIVPVLGGQALLSGRPS